jgi:hypothetical protein
MSEGGTVSNDNAKANEKQDNRTAVNEAKRKLIKKIEKGLYAAPITLAMMSTKASACSVTC